MDDETHRYIDKSAEVVSAQNDSRFTKASSEVKDVQAEMNVAKSELGAKVDGVEAQVGSLRTELTAKIDSLDAGMKSGFKRMRDKLNAQNPLTAWQIFGVMIAAFAAVAGIIFGFLMVAGVTFVAPDNQREIVELLEILIAQAEADSSRNATPEIVPENQAPASGSGTLPSGE